MKKFMKVCAITALIMCVVGMVLAAVAGSIKGRTTVENVVETVTDGKVHMKLTNWGDWGISVGERVADTVGNVSYEIGDATNFDADHEILTGTVEKYSLGNHISELNISVGGCSFETKPSGDDEFYIEAKKAGKFQGFVENGVLYVIETPTSRRLNDVGDCNIILYVPEGYSYHSASVSLGAGTLEFDNLKADNAEFSVGAGEITINGAEADEMIVSAGMGQMHLQDIKVEKLDAEVGMGEMIVNGSIGKKAVLECAMGNMEMKIEGSQKDFNYEIEGAMGIIDIGKDSYGGFASERSIDNNAEKTIEVSGSMGNISLSFTE